MEEDYQDLKNEGKVLFKIIYKGNAKDKIVDKTDALIFYSNLSIILQNRIKAIVESDDQANFIIDSNLLNQI